MLQFSLRKKLLLVSLLILLVPWVGIRYIQAIENYLQQSLLENLSHYTQSVASGLTQQADLIPEYPAGAAVFALPLQKAPQLDGYDDDWLDYKDYRQKLSANKVVVAAVNRPTVLTGLYEESLYLHINVPDQNIIYLNQGELSISSQSTSKTKSKAKSEPVDSIKITLNADSQSRTLIIETEAPGSIKAIDTKTFDWESRIKGIWLEQDNGRGYQLEIKMPFSYVSEGMNLRITNINADYSITADEKIIFNLAEQTVVPVLSSPKQLMLRVKEFGMIPGRRIWLLDNDGRVLVKSGSLTTTTQLTPVNPLFAWLLAPQLIADPWKGKTRFERDDIQRALKGESDSRRLASSRGESIILSSAWPVKVNQQTKAVLLIEESTAAIQIMQRSALSELLNLSLFVFILLSVALIGFAGHLGTRIRRLRDVTDQSIDKHGRVIGDIPESKKGDELDDLSSQVNAMLLRLRNYHEYLEKLASRLSHELRTPVAVVRSSLENLQLDEISAENIEILERADQGIHRLTTLLNRMGEASRLEQSIEDCHIESFEFGDFLEQITEGYRGIYPAQKFNVMTEKGRVEASQDLLAQCLDKLVNNAVSFALSDTPIDISLKQFSNYWQLSIYNRGPSLPEKMQSQLFQSMVSVRQSKSKNEQPHLGLGLHIVRLIAEFHDGEVSAKNQQNGVCFTLKLPTTSSQSV